MPDRGNCAKTETNCFFSQPYTVLPGVCDRSARLSHVEAFTVCQDLATLHADKLGIGAWEMAKKHLFWLTIRTRMCFFERPRMMETVTLETEMIRPGMLRGLRDYRICRDGQTLISGMTEFTLQNTRTKELHRFEEVCPPQLVPKDAPADPRPFLRIKPSFSNGVLLGTHRINSNDVDLGQHMNNVAYLRALFSLFSSQQREEMPIREIELNFRVSCYEDETLYYYTRSAENGVEFAAFTKEPGPDDRPSLLGKITF